MRTHALVVQHQAAREARHAGPRKTVQGSQSSLPMMEVGALLGSLGADTGWEVLAELGLLDGAYAVEAVSLCTPSTVMTIPAWPWLCLAQFSGACEGLDETPYC